MKWNYYHEIDFFPYNNFFVIDPGSFLEYLSDVNTSELFGFFSEYNNMTTRRTVRHNNMSGVNYIF